MNDYWNDPPDDYGEDEVSPPYDTLEEYLMDFPSEDDFYEIPMPEKCPHGKEWGNCDRCDFEGDLAFDANRERKH